MQDSKLSGHLRQFVNTNVPDIGTYASRMSSAKGSLADAGLV
jgi:hypothetical protein